MNNGVEIKIVQSSDLSSDTKSQGAKLINTDIIPSSPPLSTKTLQIASGRRKAFESKNDPNSENRSERRVSSRMPRYEDGELKIPTSKFEPIVNDEIKPTSKNIINVEKLQSDPDTGLIHLDVSPTLIRKEVTPTISKELKSIAHGNYIVESESRSRADDLDPEGVKHFSGKRAIVQATSEKSNRRPVTKSEKRIASPPAERRTSITKSPPVSGEKSDKNIHYENKSILQSKSSARKSTHKSNKKNDRPNSPHRVALSDKPVIRIAGKRATSRDMKTSAGSSTSSSSSSKTNESRHSDSSTVDTTSRRKIKSRSDAVDEKLRKKFEDEEFSPEDDEHLRFAIKTAIEESKTQSIKEAIESGHDLTAEVLKSVTRPNAIEEVVEAMVSQRREKIRENRSSSRRHIQSKPKSNREDYPIIETIEDPGELIPVSIKTSKIQIDDGIPKPKKEIPIEKKDEVEIIGEESSVKRPLRKVVRKKAFVKEPTSGKNKDEDSEENIRLPPENRKAKKGDYREMPDELGQQDSVYDPLGVDKPFGDEDDSVGDDVYDESSEDDAKLTIAEKKDEMLFRFKLIQEAYPGKALPRITKKMKLAKMVRLYEHVMSQIKLKVKTNNFKIFLIVGFLAMQFAAKKFGADSSGFTINQMSSMKHYEKYLREIGESDFSSIGSEMPVMFRLPFFMVVNMGIFLVAKWIFKKTGKDYSTEFHKLYAQLTGGDDYVYIKDDAKSGLDAGEPAGEDGGGGIFGMIKSFMGMVGGGGGDSDATPKPKRGEATGPSYSRRKKAPAE